MAEGGSDSLNVEAQKVQIGQLIKKPLVKGENWYLLDCRWYKQWKKYVGFENWDSDGAGERSSHPGPVDNSPILREDGSGEIREHLIDELDYVLVPEDAWVLLMQWYNLAAGQAPIMRKVVEYGMFVKHCKVEVYLIEFKLCENSDLDKHVIRKFSKADTIETIEKEMRKVFGIPDEVETRLWNRYSSNTYEQLPKKEITVQDAGLYPSQMLIIERQNDDGTWPRQVKSFNGAPYNNATSSVAAENKSNVSGPSSGMNTRYAYSNYSEGTAGSAQPGVCGLSNLGNTCFMNSVLQCMSNCPPTTLYFLENRYWNELNEENPLGMGGEIAKAFADLVRVMWSGRYTYTMPRNFKMQVGRFAPQFSGYQQHDSQELLTFLLDGLHEDLNRIKQKPYIELKDSDGHPDEEVAREAWENYRKRNDSVIVDVFHGLLKSTVVCPECPKVSVTFDPFCYLSLPLPQHREMSLEVFYVPSDPLRHPVKLRLLVPKAGLFSDLCQAAARQLGVVAERLVPATIYRHRFQSIYRPQERLSSVQDRNDMFLYELPVTPEEDSDIQVLAVYLREQRSNNASSGSSNKGGLYGHDPLFGQPFLVAVPSSKCTYDMLYNTLTYQMQRYVTCPNDNEQWWKDPELPLANGEVEVCSKGEESPLDEDTQESVADQLLVNGNDNCLKPQIQSQQQQQKEVETVGPRRLFTIRLLDGPEGCTRLEDTIGPISFPRQRDYCYVVLDWTRRARELFYLKEEADAYETHENTGSSGHWLASSRPQPSTTQLRDCLELYTTTEKLGADDAWYCPACKQHQQATKKFDLWTLPQILIIHLKRFSYNRHWRDKLDAMVDFPTRGLNMGPYVINPNHPPAVYDLIGVCNHYGSLGGGHYTAYAKNKDDNQWYHFDDSSVSQSTEESVVTKAAYVLFYMRRDSSSVALRPPSSVGPQSPSSLHNQPHISHPAHPHTVTSQDTTPNGEGSPSDLSGDEEMDVN